ncbi:MAG TPA: hypothetical protein VHN77_04180 [Phycisphaerales bacterium]|nr:hypothetical protein [Phycisphaerales bacterium]
MSTRQELQFVFREHTPNEWLSDHALIPGIAMAVGLAVESGLRWFFDYKHSIVLAGEMVRGGGAILACLLLITLKTLLDGYAEAVPHEWTQARSTIKTSTRTVLVAAIACSFVSVLCLGLFALLEIFLGTENSAKWTGWSLIVINVCLSGSAVVLGYSKFLEVRSEIIDRVLHKGLA